MITGLDHLVLLCPSIQAGTAIYSALLGRDPDWSSISDDGTATTLFQLDNTALELIAPHGSGNMTGRLGELLSKNGPGLQSLVFATDDIAQAHHLATRRGLKADDIQSGASTNQATNTSRQWQRFRLANEETHGTRIFILQREPTDPLTTQPANPAAVHALDHAVINTGAPDRTLALYGARLGLRLALDRSNPDWDARLIFFKPQNDKTAPTIEIAHRLSIGEHNDPDKFWGLSWRTNDIHAMHARLSALGLNISDVRTGRRPGSHVFTVRDGTMNVPTLILEAEPANAAP